HQRLALEARARDERALLVLGAVERERQRRLPVVERDLGRAARDQKRARRLEELEQARRRLELGLRLRRALPLGARPSTAAVGLRARVLVVGPVGVLAGPQRPELRLRVFAFLVVQLP